MTMGLLMGHWNSMPNTEGECASRMLVYRLSSSAPRGRMLEGTSCVNSFSQYLVLSAVLRRLGDGYCYHAQNPVRWLTFNLKPRLSIPDFVLQSERKAWIWVYPKSQYVVFERDDRGIVCTVKMEQGSTWQPCIQASLKSWTCSMKLVLYASEIVRNLIDTQNKNVAYQCKRSK